MSDPVLPGEGPTAASVERGRRIAESMMAHAIADWRAEQSPGMPHPPAQERPSGPGTSDVGSGRGTGVPEPHARPQGGTDG